jgi:hypothetical protein
VEGGGSEFIQLALPSELSHSSTAVSAGSTVLAAMPESGSDLLLEDPSSLSTATYQYRTVQIKGLSYNSILGQ